MEGAIARMTRDEVSAPVEIQEIVHLGLMVYTLEGFELFLTTPMGIFDGQTALYLIENGESEQVFSALAEDYEGMGW